MEEFQNKRKFRKIIFSWQMLTLLSFALSFMVFFTVKVSLKNRVASSKRNEALKQLEELQERKAELEAEILRLQSPSGEEEEIRSKFNVSKPGEEVLVIVDKNIENGKINTEEGEEGLFSKMWKWIKNLF